MSSLVMEIEDYDLPAGQPVAVSRRATYFLLMTGSGVDVEFSYKGSRIGGGKGLQGGDAVGPLSQAYDQVTLSSATAQAVKIATSSDPVTITRLSGVVKVDGVIEQAADYSRVIAERAFIASRNVPGGSGEYSYCQIWNPVGSGKELVIPSLSIKGADGVLGYLSTTELADTVNNYVKTGSICLKAKNPQVAGSEIVLSGNSAGANEISGVLSPSNFALNEGWADLRQPIVVDPGAGFGIRSRLVGQDISLFCQYFEVDL